MMVFYDIGPLQVCLWLILAVAILVLAASFPDDEK